MSTYIKLALYVLILVGAIVFVFFFPNSGIEEQLIVLVSSIASAYGIYDWREKYGVVKEWFKSKTKFGAIATGIILLVLLLVPVFGIALPELLSKILEYLLILTGGSTLVGIFDTIKTKNSNLQ